MQVLLRFNVLLLKILWNLCSGGKCLFIKRKKHLSMFVFTVSLEGGLNHMMLLLVFLFPFGFLHFALSKLSKVYLNFSLYLELARFCSWDGTALRNISLDNITEIILLILILGSALWLMVEGQNLCGCISFHCLFFRRLVCATT